MNVRASIFGINVIPLLERIHFYLTLSHFLFRAKDKARERESAGERAPPTGAFRGQRANDNLSQRAALQQVSATGSITTHCGDYAQHPPTVAGIVADRATKQNICLTIRPMLYFGDAVCAGCYALRSSLRNTVTDVANSVAKRVT